MKNKPLWIGLMSGGITAIATAIVTMVYSPTFLSKTHRNYAVACTAGITSFITTFSLGIITAQKLRFSTNRLENCLEDISEGKYNIRIPIYANDELQDLTKKFNSMADVICNLLINLKIRAERSEQDKEKIASQVIKLLDKVDTAAHGQLHVKVKVRCEELGIISYCINMTLNNFLKLVKKVDYDSQEIITLITTDSQTIFQNLSLESQWQAEEIDSFLQSLEVIVDSFYQRACKAWEAEQVYQEISNYASTSYHSIGNIFQEVITAYTLISEIHHKVKRLTEYNYDLNQIKTLVEQMNIHNRFLLLNTTIFASRKTSNEELLKIAIKLQEMANNWELIKKKLEHFQHNVQSLNLTISENNIPVEEFPQQKLGEEVKQGLTKIVQNIYKFNNYIDNVASLGENHTDNLQKITEFLQIIHKKNIERSQVTKQLYDSSQKIINITENLAESVKHFTLEKTE
ncbi:MAG: methyl-accepting chemotaxis protein [Okeania sp. SIO2C9]|uniref:HAMP domain-containing protein n=1 Tax=Okeania sp. SIO2C9 TaxID=2607791 RepID=UPI0013C19D7B|nr:methyl-accepting chemotaxis protein [Okeania sp. SIO2C9]NEQ74146.1 methyl-accepting chemotaxis protein [Okeania sp. SIO2C9]